MRALRSAELTGDTQELGWLPAKRATSEPHPSLV